MPRVAARNNMRGGEVEANSNLIRCPRRSHPFCSCTYAVPRLSCERGAARSCCVLHILSVSFGHSAPHSGHCGSPCFMLLRPRHSRHSLCFDAPQFPLMSSIMRSFSPSFHSNSRHINTICFGGKCGKKNWSTELFPQMNACII